MYVVATWRATMGQVGIRELRDHLSRYLKRVKAGEQMVVVERGKPVAKVVPSEPSAIPEALAAFLREGGASWAGGKPQGTSKPPRISGKPLSDLVLEDRE
jgi:prevent-host-death family protein